MQRQKNFSGMKLYNWINSLRRGFVKSVSFIFSILIQVSMYRMSIKILANYFPSLTNYESICFMYLMLWVFMINRYLQRILRLLMTISCILRLEDFKIHLASRKNIFKDVCLFFLLFYFLLLHFSLPSQIVKKLALQNK